MSIIRRDGLTLTLELGFATTAPLGSTWDAAVWDTGTWGPDTVYTDVTAYLRTWSTQTGKQRELGAYEAGRATFLLNNRDARFSPTNLAGPYVSAGTSQIRPWLPVRFSATWAGMLYRVFVGYVVSWTEATPGQRDYITTIACVDEFAMLARFTSPALVSAGAGESSGARVHRILNNAGSDAPRDIDVGNNTCQATTLAGQALSLLQGVADGENGGIYVTANGTITFDGQTRLETRPRSTTPQATFGDLGAELDMFDLTPAFDGDLVANIVTRQRNGGIAQTVADANSRSLNGDQQDTVTNLIVETDAQAYTTAANVLAHRKDAESRFTRMVIKPAKDPTNLWPQAFGRQIRDRITVKRRPRSTANETITKDVFIEGIAHAGTPDDWTTVFSLSSASTYLNTAAYWDSARWDSDRWFY